MVMVDPMVTTSPQGLKTDDIRSLGPLTAEYNDDPQGIGVVRIVNDDTWPVEPRQLQKVAQRLVRSLAMYRGFRRLTCDLPIFPDNNSSIDCENPQFIFTHRRADADERRGLSFG